MIRALAIAAALSALGFMFVSPAVALPQNDDEGGICHDKKKKKHADGGHPDEEKEEELSSSGPCSGRP